MSTVFIWSDSDRFTVVAVMDGRPFTRVRAGNKRDCKNGAAYLAWRTLIQEQQQSVRPITKLSPTVHMSRHITSFWFTDLHRQRVCVSFSLRTRRDLHLPSVTVASFELTVIHR